jgi:hypothetical protein
VKCCVRERQYGARNVKESALVSLTTVLSAQGRSYEFGACLSSEGSPETTKKKKDKFTTREAKKKQTRDSGLPSTKVS